MKFKTISLCVLFALTTAASAAASTFERILIPIHTQIPVPGAHGSLWTSVLLARNDSSAAVALHNIWCCCIGLCFNIGDLEGGETAVVRPTGADDRPGAIIEVDPSRADALAFSLRVQDLSRERQTWGTEIPVVRERELRTSGFALVGVPLSAAFRSTLRIYAIDAPTPAQVRVRLSGIVPGDTESWLRERRETLRDEVFLLRPPVPGRRHAVPSYLELGDLSSAAPPDAFDIVNVEIIPVTPGLRVWAFVAVVNNETQHVTTITPQ